MISIFDLLQSLHNISIAKKAAILIGLPLAVQILLVAGCRGLHKEIDLLTYRAEVIQEITTAARQLIILETAIIHRGDELTEPDHSPSDRASSRQAYSNDLKRAQKWAGILRERWGDSPANCMLVNQIVTSTKQLEQTMAEPDNAKDKRTALTSVREANLNHLLFTLGEQLPAVEDPKEQLTIQQKWLTIYLACLVLNTVVIIFMLIVLSREIIGRLEHVVGNSIRFSEDRSILPAETGSDEIARLDQAFHAMSKTILELTRKQKAIIKYSTDVLCALNKDGRIVSVNEAAQRLWGYEPRKLTNALVQEIVVTDERQAFVARLQAVCQDTLKTLDPFDVCILRADGSIAENIWSVNWSEPDRTIVCVAHDVSEHKAAQRFRQELLQMVSHDLRNPLTSIRGFHVMLETGIFGKLNEQAAHQLALASSNTTQMLSLINDLLDLEKIEADMLEIEKKKTPLSDIFDQSLQAVKAEAEEKGIDLVATATDHTIIGDRHRLVQTLTNLLHHAIKTSPPQGRILVVATNLPSSVEINVIDQALTIPPNKRSTIFERFQHLGSAQFAGTTAEDNGLMLAISKALVEKHGGEIGVDSEINRRITSEGGLTMHANMEAGAGRGNRFWFCIPA